MSLLLCLLEDSWPYFGFLVLEELTVAASSHFCFVKAYDFKCASQTLRRGQRSWIRATRDIRASAADRKLVEQVKLVATVSS